ncbi:MAG: hypothetical protein PHH36_00810 [Sideroxydans sp.]|nr:hypothetical protein [Sideroxydans sp.]
MELSELGLDGALAEQAECASGLHLARVVAVDRGHFVVRSERGEALAELTGKFLYTADSSAKLKGSA